MKFNRSLFVLILLFVISLFFVMEGKTQPLFGPEGGKPPIPGTRAPIIKHAFAVEKGYYGYIWKIYIEAEDPDGDMLRIASVVDQTGYGHYPADWIYLKPPYQKHFKGYIQWNTTSSKTSYLTEGTQITLRVSVFDKAGNESNEVIFPFTFEIGFKSPYLYTLPASFDQGDLPRLGYVQIDLYDPTRDGGRNGSGGGNI
jgi:hypothetical protein